MGHTWSCSESWGRSCPVLAARPGSARRAVRPRSGYSFFSPSLSAKTQSQVLNRKEGSYWTFPPVTSCLVTFHRIRADLPSPFKPWAGPSNPWETMKTGTWSWAGCPTGCGDARSSEGTGPRPCPAHPCTPLLSWDLLGGTKPPASQGGHCLTPHQNSQELHLSLPLLPVLPSETKQNNGSNPLPPPWNQKHIGANSASKISEQGEASPSTNLSFLICKSLPPKVAEDAM